MQLTPSPGTDYGLARRDVTGTKDTADRGASQESCTQRNARWVVSNSDRIVEVSCDSHNRQAEEHDPVSVAAGTDVSPWATYFFTDVEELGTGLRILADRCNVCSGVGVFAEDQHERE